MRRWVLAAILAATAAWGAWTLVQRRREAIRQNREIAWMAAYQGATRAFYGADYPVAEKLLTDVLPETETLHPRDRSLADVLTMLGTSYSLEHKSQQAEPILKQALEVYERISPPDLLGEERTEITLGGIYEDREDYAAADQHFSKALSLSDQMPNGPTYERGNTLLHLGFVRMVQGRYPEAEQLLNGSVEALAPDSSAWAQRDLANAFYRLGGVYDAQDRYSEAEQQYLKAMQVQEKLSGPSSPELRGTLQGLAQVYQDEGDSAKAAALVNRAEKIALVPSANEASSRANSLLDRGAAAQNQGRYAEAESLYKQAIEFYKKDGKPDDPDLARALVYLGYLYRDQSQFDISKAGPLFQRALAIREKALGPEHPSTGDTLSDLSLVEFYEHKPGEAERFAERALPIQEKAYGTDSLPVSTTLNRLGLAERDLKKFAQAEVSLKRALAIREKNLPSDHPWIATSLDNLASVYLAEGNMGKAVPLMKRVQAIRAHSPAD